MDGGVDTAYTVDTLIIVMIKISAEDVRLMALSGSDLWEEEQCSKSVRPPPLSSFHQIMMICIANIITIIIVIIAIIIGKTNKK